MADFIATLCNSRLLRLALKNTELETIELACQKLNDIYKERKAEEEEKQQQQAQRLDALKNIKALMHENGLSLEDLDSLIKEDVLNQPKKQTRNVPPKYQFTDETGKIYTWTGQGRTPSILTACMAREHKSIEEYLIKQES